MIYFTAHTFNCVCHCIRVMFRLLGMYNFGEIIKCLEEVNKKIITEEVKNTFIELVEKLRKIN